MARGGRGERPRADAVRAVGREQTTYKSCCGGVRLRAPFRARADRTRESDRRSRAGPTRLGRREVRLRCGRVGLKGAVAGGVAAGCQRREAPRCREDELRRRKHRRERVKRVTEERSEAQESSRLGLWRCSQTVRQQLFIRERLGLWRCSPPIRPHLFINKRLRPQDRSRNGRESFMNDRHIESILKSTGSRSPASGSRSRSPRRATSAGRSGCTRSPGCRRRSAGSSARRGRR